MKKLCLSLALAFSLCTSANAMVFNNVEQAISHGQTNDKLVFILAYSDSCRYCHIFMNNLKNHPRYQEFIQENNFVLADIEQNLELFANYFQIEVTPTVYVINPHHRDIYVPEVKGNVDIDKFLEYADEVRKYFNSYADK